MNRRRLHRRVPAALLLAAALVVGLVPGSAAAGNGRQYMQRMDPAEASPTGQSVAVDCNPDGTTDPETWPNASARLRLRQRGGHTVATFVVRKARPNTLMTAWLLIEGEDSNGDPYGASPLTGIPVTPLAPSSELPDHVAATPPNPGSDALSNGFRTDHRGNGRLTIELDFPLSSGAYPFQRFPGFEQSKHDVALTNDANLGRLHDIGLPSATLRPTAIAEGSFDGSTIFLASHCVDDTAHGLLPGPHENWFAWGSD